MTGDRIHHDGPSERAAYSEGVGGRECCRGKRGCSKRQCETKRSEFRRRNEPIEYRCVRDHEWPTDWTS